MPKVLKLDIEVIQTFLDENKDISLRKAVAELKDRFGISVSIEKLRQLFPNFFYKSDNIRQPRPKAILEEEEKERERKRGIKIAKQRIREKSANKVENSLDEILDSVLARMKLRMNVLNTLDYNLAKTIQATEQGKIKELTPQDKKELASYIYALNKTSQFLFAELESFMRISDMADLKHLYKNIETNSGAELDEILFNLIGQNKLIDEKEEGGEENE